MALARRFKYSMKLANAASTDPVTPSMKKIAMLVPAANGESLWPKHTGHANAVRGAPTSTRAVRSVRIG
jgi:hypothetical protein